MGDKLHNFKPMECSSINHNIQHSNNLPLLVNSKQLNNKLNSSSSSSNNSNNKFNSIRPLPKVMRFSIIIISSSSNNSSSNITKVVTVPPPIPIVELHPCNYHPGILPPQPEMER